MNEQDFAERIARKLDRGLDDLAPGNLYRLRLARERALLQAQDLASRGQPSRALPGSASAILLNRRVLVPLLGLILGLSAVLFWQQNSLQPDYAELDAQVLSDELPMMAYLDTGFEIWLYHHTAD